jgi:hypothetical protein
VELVEVAWMRQILKERGHLFQDESQVEADVHSYEVAAGPRKAEADQVEYSEAIEDSLGILEEVPSYLVRMGASYEAVDRPDRSVGDMRDLEATEAEA